MSLNANLTKLSDPEWVREKLFQAYLRATTDPPQSGKIEGFLHPIEERCLQWAAARVPAGGTIVEIGSYLGKSAVNLAHGVKKKGKGATVYCVDTWRNETIEHALHVDVFDRFMANVLPHADVIVPVRGRSEQMGREWKSGPIDVLFIDGDHSYEGVMHDIESWIPHLRRGGLALFHDTGLEDVDRAIEAARHLIRPSRELKAWSIRVFWKG